MENEQRPSKIQKRDHSPDTRDAQFSAPTVTSKANEDHDSNSKQTNHSEPETSDQDESKEKTSSSQNLAMSHAAITAENGEKPISKNQLKKLRRQQAWDAGAEDRRAKRRDKAKARRQAQVLAKEMGEEIVSKPAPPTRRSILVPVTILFDCDFDDLMMDHERKSLAGQITRCYSDNRKSAFRTHMAVTSFGKQLKERYVTTLNGQHLSWKEMQFFPEDFVEVAGKAQEWMTKQNGGRLAGALASDGEVELSELQKQGEVIYLSSDSDKTLTELKPYTTYIIGGIVDKNRHKGLCHKRALDRGIKTAKLPIGEFLKLNSRKVLATNHVSEIMLKWLEFGDWGEAFMAVIPKRKGGELRQHDENATSGDIIEETEECNEDGATLAEDNDKVAAAKDGNGENIQQEPDTAA